MGLNAYVLCIGNFSKEIDDCLFYGAEFYEDTEPGRTVITHKLHCNTNEQSNQLAEVLGCEVWDFNTHRINNQRINWPALYDISDTADWNEKAAISEFHRLLRVGFMCIYMPNG